MNLFVLLRCFAVIIMAPGPIPPMVIKRQYFKATEALPSEMARLGAMRREEPEAAAGLIKLGDHMVKLVRNGDLMGLTATLDRTKQVGDVVDDDDGSGGGDA